jgi:putative flippase GtrA
VSVVSTAIDMAILLYLVQAEWLAPVPANIVSFSLGTLISFESNRRLTFPGNSRPNIVGSLAAYSLTALTGLLISTAMVWLLSPAIGPLIAKAASLPVTFAWSYTWSRLVVFRTKRKT